MSQSAIMYDFHSGDSESKKGMKNGRSVQFFFVGLAASLFILQFPTGVVAQTAKTDDQVLIEGLRTRHLFQLAEKQIADRIANPEISELDRGNLIIELIQTRVAAAIQAPPAQGPSMWKSAYAAGNDFLRNNPHPREILIRVQIELARLTEGKFLSQQLAAGVRGNDLRSSALQSIANSRRGLEQIERDIDRLIPQAQRANGDSDQLTVAELTSLQRNIRYQIANCNIQSAKLFPADDQLNRIDALQQVMKRLDEVDKQTNSQMPLWWEIQIDRVEALRSLGDFNDARQQLNKLSDQEILNSDLRKSEFLEQEIELAMDQGRGDMNKLVAAATQIVRRTPQLDLALVRLMMQTGTAANSPQERANWQQSASQLTQTIEQTHGRYWGRLAELAVIGDVNSGSAGTSSTNLDILVRVGDEAWRKGNLDDAIKAFQKALSQAESEQNSGAAMSCGMKLSRVWEQQKNHLDAGRKLVEVAMNHPRHETAAAAHLRGCWNLGQAAAVDKKLVEQFQKDLLAHLATWPNAQTNGQAHLWLARFQASQKQWGKAFENLVSVSVESPQLADASTLLPTVVAALIEQLEQQGKNGERESQAVTERMMAKLNEAGVGPNDSWTRGTRNLLLATTRVALTHQGGQAKTLGGLLNRALAESTDASPAWQNSATAWMIVTMAAQQETAAESIEFADRLAQSSENTLAECFSGLASLKSSAESNQVETLKLKIIDLALKKPGLDAATKNRWLSRKSTLLVDSGRGGEAISMLKGLVQQNPRRADLRIQLAKALTDVEGKTDEALSQWRIVASGVKPQSENWFTAKYHVAKLLAKGGKSEDARKLLQYIRAVPPGWSQSKLSDDFEGLLEKLKRSP